ncbi:MAG TPA: hypothetical protein DDZ88_12155 [Verrucomicrobiales bacterium]|nr:hypothetical protein [Verrucomicrobiales bacterium]
MAKRRKDLDAYPTPRRWGADDKVLEELWNSGTPISLIGLHLGRTEAAIHLRVHILRNKGVFLAPRQPGTPAAATKYVGEALTTPYLTYIDDLGRTIKRYPARWCMGARPTPSIGGMFGDGTSNEEMI